MGKQYEFADETRPREYPCAWHIREVGKRVGLCGCRKDMRGITCPVQPKFFWMACDECAAAWHSMNPPVKEETMTIPMARQIISYHLAGVSQSRLNEALRFLMQNVIG